MTLSELQQTIDECDLRIKQGEAVAPLLVGNFYPNVLAQQIDVLKITRAKALEQLLERIWP